MFGLHRLSVDPRGVDVTCHGCTRKGNFSATWVVKAARHSKSAMKVSSQQTHAEMMSTGDGLYVRKEAWFPFETAAQDMTASRAWSEFIADSSPRVVGHTSQSDRRSSKGEQNSRPRHLSTRGLSTSDAGTQRPCSCVWLSRPFGGCVALGEQEDLSNHVPEMLSSSPRRYALSQMQPDRDSRRCRGP
ncbi:hypothetical protein NM208_g10680 [Fusarium decemcellulare]|uniref:Uncharacterized protein n=1 Tax=Fusarium decemcellulare TaxID=57161 RepID=A0ACC1RX10_9HYPO|nr:hypothetical protein NM208_g10680 [Fusarium decemcellulare]